VAVRVAARISLLSAVLALAACAMPDTDSFRAPTAENFFRPQSSMSNFKDKVLPPVAAEDMVDTSGRCAGAFVPAAAGGDQPAGTNVSLKEAGVPVIPAAIALEMNECDVVKRAGVAERVEIGTNERSERTAKLTYINGQRPGIYYFTAGRLTSMERAPEPPAPQKPAKKQAKPTKRAAQPNAISVQ
jgi:hypothetical protein